MPVKKVTKKFVTKKVTPQTEFVPKPITDPPPETYPKSPSVNDCTHSNKVFVKGKAGWNCNDCGFFIPISTKKKEVVIEKPPPPVPIEPEKLKLPKMNADYNIMEIPLAIFDIGHKRFVKDESQLGEEDKRKMIVFNEILGEGYKIKTISRTVTNTYLFLFEKT